MQEEDGEEGKKIRSDRAWVSVGPEGSWLVRGGLDNGDERIGQRHKYDTTGSSRGRPTEMCK